MIKFELNQKIGKKIINKNWQRWLEKIVKELKLSQSLEISLALVGFDEIKQLNKIYRGKNKITDVLSFSENDSLKINSVFSDRYLGEVIICYPQAALQAKADRKTMIQELEKLFIHGVLHLLGYDHQNNAEADVMEALESKILAK